MRLLYVFLLFSVIYLTSAQRMAANGYMSNGYGSTTGYMPTSNGYMPTSGNRPPGNMVTRFFGNLFGGGRTAKQNSEVADPLSKEDFRSQLPKKPTDVMINDAIAQHIREEGSAQESVGSPFIVTPEEPKTADKQQLTVDSKEGQFNKITSSNRDGKSMPDSSSDKIPIAEALRIVNTSNLVDCVARVICELSCNANAYGNPGRTVFRNLIKLQFDPNVKSDDAKFFRQAASKGRQIVQGKKDCSECYTIYSNCKSSSKDLVAVSSMFKL